MTFESYRVTKAVILLRILFSVNLTIIFDTKEIARLIKDLPKRTSKDLIRILLLCKPFPFSLVRTEVYLTLIAVSYSRPRYNRLMPGSKGKPNTVESLTFAALPNNFLSPKEICPNDRFVRKAASFLVVSWSIVVFYRERETL
jgi:hypothetical protein